MGRPKGGTNRHWSDEERLKYVLMCEEDHLAVLTVAKRHNLPEGTLRGWIRRYRELVEKLQIENERLKKGYIVKGVGASKEFVTLKDLNSR